MQDTAQFRCPFEVKGREDNTIIEVSLGEDKKQRLDRMVAAFVQFHSRLESPAIRFVLPSSVLATCKDIRALKMGILPYQAELLAAEIDFRIRPLISYHLTTEWAHSFVEEAKSDTKKIAAATVLLGKLKELGIQRPMSIIDQAMWIETLFRVEMHKGLANPTEDMSVTVTDKPVPVIRLQPSSVMFYLDREHPKDRATNKNCFSIVKCPFYPIGFGRYSEEVEIVVSREADFANLADELRKTIRVRANTVLRKHGVQIGNLESDVQPLGLWIPGEHLGSVAE